MAFCWSETEGKSLHDTFYHLSVQPTWVDGPIVVGAGPSGLAVAACLIENGVNCLVLERSDCIASLWKHKTYDRLRLHLPKQFCELPFVPFPPHFPTYPTKQQFLGYLEDYARRFAISPVFNQAVESAEYDELLRMWRVRTGDAMTGKEREYLCRWLVVATGENADASVPEMEGISEFHGPVIHTSDYRSGDVYSGKKVIVVGCGNSGMEVCLDLCNFNAHPTMVVRDAVHVLPREMLGRSTFGLSMWLLKWLPVRTVDKLLLLLSRLLIGDTGRLGLPRPHLGPLELKSISGKTPVLDVGTLLKIRSGDIKVSVGVERFTKKGAEFVDGSYGEFDAIVMATGYKSNVPSWLKEREFFSEKDGLPRKPFPYGWKGENGLYAVGFTKRGILGASMDAKQVAGDIEQRLRLEAKQSEKLCQLQTTY